jgi:hypothetical protein
MPLIRERSKLLRCSIRALTERLNLRFSSRKLSAGELSEKYAEAALRYCRERNLDVRKFDIKRHVLKKAARSDLAVSLEVAEHLPEKRADRFVDLLRSLAPVVVCSAAKPQQGGLDHVNCQPQSYWIEKFERRGYRFDCGAVDALRAEWRAQGVAGYYYENVTTVPARRRPSRRSR